MSTAKGRNFLLVNLNDTHPRSLSKSVTVQGHSQVWHARCLIVLTKLSRTRLTRKKTLSKVPASFVIYVLCFSAYLLFFASKPPCLSSCLCCIKCLYCLLTFKAAHFFGGIKMQNCQSLLKRLHFALCA